MFPASRAPCSSLKAYSAAEELQPRSAARRYHWALSAHLPTSSRPFASSLAEVRSPRSAACRSHFSASACWLLPQPTARPGAASP